MNKYQERMLALAGAMQAATLVDYTATQKILPWGTVEPLYRSISITDPKNTLEVFGNIKNVKFGLKTLHSLLSRSENVSRKSIEYWIQLLSLANTLSRKKIARTNLIKALKEDNTITKERLSSIYSQCLSPLKPRIIISGTKEWAKDEEKIMQARALLLSGVRAGVLWQQLGGRPWHTILFKKRYIKAIESLLEA